MHTFSKYIFLGDVLNLWHISKYIFIEFISEYIYFYNYKINFINDMGQRRGVRKAIIFL